MSFDPAAFLNFTIEEVNSTEQTPVPEGELLAIADKVEIVPWASRDGSSSGLKLQIIWDIQDEPTKQLLNRSKVTCRQDLMLDLTEQGNLDMGKGKNVPLGRLRSAVDLNTPGQPFSFPMIQGRMATVAVKHRIANDTIYAEVKGVTKAA